MSAIKSVPTAEAFREAIASEKSSTQKASNLTGRDKLSLSELEQRYGVWRGSSGSQIAQQGLATGHSAIDEALHIGGWPEAGLMEFLLKRPGIGELSLLMPAIARYLQNQQRIAFVGLPYVLMPQALRRFGISPQQLWCIQAKQQDEQLWAAQQLLKSGHCLMVIIWQLQQKVSSSQLRKLQVAARDGVSCGVILRHERWAAEASPAAMRIRLASCCANSFVQNKVKMSRGLKLDILKQPGTFSGQKVFLENSLVSLVDQQSLLSAELPTTQQLQAESDQKISVQENLHNRFMHHAPNKPKTISDTSPR